jgi:NADH-quinone oxidoreductase subunit L
MRYMGGLRKKMPGTFIAFLVGGLALSGFPLITSGFWSKDEILAEAYHALTHGDALRALPVFAFFALVIAAFFTAFYTWRQITMTFLGKPRTESAASASESSKSMVVPLLILAVFTLLLGFVGVHEDFPVLGPLLGGNPFHHFIGDFAKSLGIEAATIPFSWLPVLFSTVLALGGIFVGWWVYGRAGKGWQTHDQLDPLEAGMRKVGLGGLYNAMRNKFYFDELYDIIFVRFSLWLSRASAWFDRTVIDGVVNAAGRFGYWVSNISARFDSRFVDGIVNGLGSLANRAGSALRLVQTGQGQTYLLVALLTVLLLLALFAVQVAGIGVVG